MAEDVIDLLVHLEAPSPESAILQARPRLRIPSTSSILAVCPAYFTDGNLPDAFYIRWNTTSQALNITMCMLYLLVNEQTLSHGEIRAGRFPSSENGWILSSMTRIWRMLHPEGEVLDYGQTSVLALNSLLSSVRLLLVQMNGASERCRTYTIAVRIVRLLDAIVTSLLQSVQLQLPASVETAICLVLKEAKASSEKSSSLRQCLIEHFIPSLSVIEARHRRFESLGPELQVRYSSNRNRLLTRSKLAYDTFHHAFLYTARQRRIPKNISRRSERRPDRPASFS